MKLGKGECLRGAVAAAYGIPLAQTPKVSGYSERMTRTWVRWAEKRGLVWLHSTRIAPIHIGPWIACIDGGEGPGTHAIAMNGEKVVRDPDGRVTELSPWQVHSAWWLSDELKLEAGDVWVLPNRQGETELVTQIVKTTRSNPRRAGRGRYATPTKSTPRMSG